MAPSAQGGTCPSATGFPADAGHLCPQFRVMADDSYPAGNKGDESNAYVQLCNVDTLKVDNSADTSRV